MCVPPLQVIVLLLLYCTVLYKAQYLYFKTRMSGSKCKSSGDVAGITVLFKRSSHHRIDFRCIGQSSSKTTGEDVRSASWRSEQLAGADGCLAGRPLYLAVRRGNRRWSSPWLQPLSPGPGCLPRTSAAENQSGGREEPEAGPRQTNEEHQVYAEGCNKPQERPYTKPHLDSVGEDWPWLLYYSEGGECIEKEATTTSETQRGRKKYIPTSQKDVRCPVWGYSFDRAHLPPALCPPLAPGGPDYRPHPPHHEARDHLLEFETKRFKVPVARVTSYKPSRRGSTLSLSRTSGGSSPQSSMVSVNPGSDEPQSVITQATGSKDVEDSESSSAKPEEEPLHVNLQKLLEMVREDAQRTVTMADGMQKQAASIFSTLRQNKSDSAYKDMQTTRKSSDRSSSTSGDSHSQVLQKKSKSRSNRDIIHCKSGVCNALRAKFNNVAQEAGLCLQDKMEILMKRQEERGLQKFRSFDLVSNFQKDVAKMRHHISMAKGDAEEIAQHWYFDLLSKLPEDLKNFRPAKKILAKLQKFGENLDLRIRPHVLLKVLQDMRVWELCSPDIAVAVELRARGGG
ncbi:coiled-coil domain-containing protein 60 isoform X3 [Orcinus orca]|uniref:coiled-coil domain-containing protein 60 isoform X3 n=1 Tax=Orcinus orca TaxID=9733 RepID=UPI002113600E|nr:coiled-coil domain-containing protein 60 isoform X3 [Orcinus orca]